MVYPNDQSVTNMAFHENIKQMLSQPMKKAETQRLRQDLYKDMIYINKEDIDKTSQE